MSRAIYESRPWLALYSKNVPPDLEPSVASSLLHFEAAASSSPRSACLFYFDTSLDYETVTGLTDSLAVALAERGIGPGERVAVMLQNMPQFVLAELAAWKVGAAIVPLSPMLRHQEVEYQLADSGAKALVALEGLYSEVVESILGGTQLQAVLTTSALDFLNAPPQPLAGLVRLPASRRAGAEDLIEVLKKYQGRKPPRFMPEPSDVAYLTYTSGTTGKPKAAINTHLNVAFSAEVYRAWLRLGNDDVILGAAPLFHITGLVAHVAAAFAAGIPLALSYRFDPETILRQIEQRRCTFTMASITAFLALMDHPDIRRRNLSTLSKVYSGGAPVAPATVERFRQLTGVYIHNVYGLTETASPSHATPLGARAPVDAESGSLSVGVPVPSTTVRVVDMPTGQDVPPGEAGELWTRGPQVAPGYWRRADATRDALVDGYLRTGDVGKMDPSGWFYIVDRAKDMIICSGYKVWPREVEDFLYQHPAVKEAAVVGVPHSYRGETVKAFVSLKSGFEVEPEELIDFCRQRMAAYKYPRSLEILGEIPKTASGKFLRRELRERARRDAEGGHQTNSISGKK